MNTKSFGFKAATKVLGGLHFVGQTVADLSLNAEIKLNKPVDNDAVIAIIKARNARSYELAVKLHLLPNPLSAVADMTQSEG